MSAAPDRPVDLRVLLVTSWDTPCGIAAHSAMLKEAVERADPGIKVNPVAEALDADLVVREYLLPQGFTSDPPRDYLIHLNHHDALHSRWTPEHVRRITQDHGIPVLVTYHDTTADPSPTSKLAQLAQVASSVVVHEPLHPESGIKAIYWRQPVPAPAHDPADYSIPYWRDGRGILHDGRWMGGTDYVDYFKACPQQPVLGTVGFDFPWKNFDRLAALTHDLGWAFVCLSNNMTAERVAEIKSRNPHSLVVTGYLPTQVIVNYLAGCDATAFPYECANTGTSGAIRLGIAALKPLFAFSGCRQFRDLYEDGAGHGITWVTGWEAFRVELARQYQGYVCPQIRQIAHRDSWYEAGYNYANLYRMLVGVGGSTL